MKRALLIGLDGADPVVTKRLIEAGRLPGLQKVLEMGVATENLDMLGVFPTVTPPNWASLATGNWPRTHGITCFMNHTLGKPLDVTEVNWDSRRIHSELIWEAFEDEGKRCIMLNYCEAWPNRVPNSKNVFIDGTGVIPFIRTSVDYQKVVVLEDGDFFLKEVPHIISSSSNDCVVYGDQLEEFSRPQGDFLGSMQGVVTAMAGDADQPLLETPAVVLMDFSAEDSANAAVADQIHSPLKEPKGWGIALPDGAKEAALPLNKGLMRRMVLLSATDGVHYDKVSLYANKKSATPMGEAVTGEWSEWIYDTFNVNDRELKVAYKIRVMEIATDGSKAKFYMSHVANCEDVSYYYPRELGKEMLENVGPMMSFATIERHTPIGDEICLESWSQIMDWHIRATQYLFKKYNDWSLFYTHLHGIDLCNHWYINQAIPDSHPDWVRHAEIINRQYEINDRFVQAMLPYLDGETSIFVCADHAAVPRAPGYENPGIAEISGVNAKVLSELGYTVINPVPGVEHYYQVDLSKSRAINNRGPHIYINLKGRDPGGIVEPEDYDQIVQELISDLYNYRDPVHGERVVSFAMTREEMECIGMGGPHSGDIFIQLTRNFGLEHAHAPNHVTNFGYSIGCLCMMCGGNIKQGQRIARPIRTVDIVPTIAHVCGVRMPHDVEGGVIYQALKD